MDVRFLSTRRFPGWDRFRDALHSVAPENALGVVQLLIKHLADQQDGIFQGLPPVFPTNLHVVVREWISALSTDQLPIQDWNARNEVLPVLLQACREVNDLRQHHAALSNSITLPSSMRVDAVLRKLWFHHLEQIGMYWAPKFELGRSQRLFVEIWDELLRSKRIKVAGQLGSAFLDFGYRLLLALGLWMHAGRVDDARALFSQTALSDTQVSTLLAVACPDLDAVRAQMRRAPTYPDSIQNIFHRFPLQRVGQWGVIAPLPDLALQWWDLQNLFEGLDCTIANMTDGGAVEYYRALGVVVQYYTCDLLKELAQATQQASFVEPFNFKSGHEAPDAFIVQPNIGTLVFEVKCYRIPQRAYQDVRLSGFLDWFANLLGHNDAGRPPLFQGLGFFEPWAEGNAEILARLPRADPRHSIYVIVSYEDVPSFVQWNRFRPWYQQQHLAPATHDLWKMTLVISVRELEVLVGAARVAGRPGGPVAPFNAFATMAEYIAYREAAPDMNEKDGEASMKDGLGTWLLKRWPAAAESEPALVADARHRLFEASQALGFPSP